MTQAKFNVASHYQRSHEIFTHMERKKAFFGFESNVFIGIDLGAESLRIFAGALDNGLLRLEEILRYPNNPVRTTSGLHWDVGEVFNRIKESLREVSKRGYAPMALGIDTWGVDFGLLDSQGKLLVNPFCYRDERNARAMEKFLEIFPQRRLYELTGIQIMPFNSVFQIYAYSKWNPEILREARDLLFMPDIFNYFLTGKKVTEFTFATTSQVYNPRKNAWEKEILDALGISGDLMQEVIPPGVEIGGIDSSLEIEPGIAGMRVVSVASHDTASAVAAVPATGEDWAYISSGTWSLMGIELDAPCITERSLRHNFTNEGGIGGRFRFLKNICGLWLLRKCKDDWLKQGIRLSYDEVIEMARSSRSFMALIDPDDPVFYNPESMTKAISDFCLKTGQEPPKSPGQFARVILESLALKYRYVLEEIENIFPGRVRRIHVVGGGGKNWLLNQFTANATGLEVFSGPWEATVAGNIMAQALSMNIVGNLEEMREVIRRTFPVIRYTPRDVSSWDRAYDRFLDIHRS